MKGPITWLDCCVPVGGPTYQQDTRTVVYSAEVTAVGGLFPFPILHISHVQTHQLPPMPPPPRPTQSFPKLARSTLHPVIITVPNRRRICVARPPRQSEAAVQFPLPLWPSHPPFLPVPVRSWTVCLSSKAEQKHYLCLLCVVLCAHRLCQKTPPAPPPDRLRENTQRGDGRGFLRHQDTCR